MTPTASDAENLQVQLEDTHAPFDLRRLAIAARRPIRVGPVQLPVPSEIGPATYLIKLPGQGEYSVGPEFRPDQLTPFLDTCQTFIRAQGLDWDTRSVFLFVMNHAIVAGEAQNPRAAGWHFDPNLGADGDYLFNACSTLPTEFAAQAFQGARLRPDAANIVHTEPNAVYFASVYAVHRGARAAVPTERVFMLLAVVSGHPSLVKPSSIAWRYNPDTHVVSQPKAAQREVA